MSSAYDSPDGQCPIALEALALLFRADAARVGQLVLALSPPTRARLAMFCFVRGHLRDLGLVIASHCEEQMLSHVAGAAGAHVHAQARARSAQGGPVLGEASRRNKITLAGAA
jgi:hypothetical protein